MYMCHHAQIRRFGLKDRRYHCLEIQGLKRSREKFSALLYVTTVNGLSPGGSCEKTEL